MSETLEWPTVLVVSCTSKKSAEDIIKGIVMKDILSVPEVLDNDIEAYMWNIDTKYYAAAVKLCAPKHRTVPTRAFAETVEAVVLHFDAKDRDTFYILKIWLKTIDDLYSPSVTLLTCDSYQEKEGVTKDELDQFTLENDCELIQLVPTEVDAEDEEEFGSVHGFPRVRSALHAHSWSNLKMKQLPKRRKFSDDEDNVEGETDPELRTVADQDRASPAADGASDAEDNFSQLFSRLHEFRMTAATLGPDGRRDFAEKVAKQFLKALDSDSGEISE